MKIPLFKLALWASHVVSLSRNGFVGGFSEYTRVDLCLSEFNFAGLPHSTVFFVIVTVWGGRKDSPVNKTGGIIQHQKMYIYFDASPANTQCLRTLAAHSCWEGLLLCLAQTLHPSPLHLLACYFAHHLLTSSGSHRGGTHFHIEFLYYRKSWAHLLGHIHYPAWLESLKS